MQSKPKSNKLLKQTCWLFLLFFIGALTNLAYSQDITVTGIVRSDSAALEGVSIVVKSNPSRAAKTDAKGNFTINVPSNATLIISYVGFETQQVNVNGKTSITVVLKTSESAMDDVVVVGFGGKQKKASMVSSITAINPKELKGPTSNLTTMLAGRIPGVIAYQRSGEPGADNASFFIRGLGSFGAGKVDPLILIDGIESSNNDLARLQPDDISEFSVLKDATASAVYGARGANGVIIVNTKSGADGRTKFNLRGENSWSSNTKNFKFADNITYMKLANEAVLTRTPNEVLPYSQTKIDRTASGTANPYLYPSNNWIKQLIKPYTVNQRYNLNISGGTKNAQYYIAGTYNIDNGVLNVDKLNNFNSNIKLRNYAIRSTVNLKLTKTTEAIVRVYGQFDDYKGPVGGYDNEGRRLNGGQVVFNSAIWSNPVMFPSIYPSSYMPYVKHPLFGNAIIPGTTRLYVNPYARSVSGYQQYNSSTIQAQLELKQDLVDITPGLSARAMSYIRRYSYFDVARQYNPFYYSAFSVDGKNITLSPINDGSTGSVGLVGTEYLNYTEGAKELNSTFYLEAALNYARVSDQVHAVSGMLITTMRNYQTGNAGDLQGSLPARNQGVSGRFTYGFDTRYLAEFNFGYNGSERFAKNSRFGFFPSGGLAWNISNEKFFDPLVNTVTRFKIRATYGLVGNDQIGSRNDRFFYLSNVNMNSLDRAAFFGQDMLFGRTGIAISRYANNKITWEKSTQLNIGTDITLFKSLDLVVDVYKQKRKNILMARSFIPTTMGLQAGVSANVGEAESKGIDIALNYNKTFGPKWWVQARSNFTYATSKILVYDEPTYADNEAYLYRVGHSVSQWWGFIAERLFTDDNEVDNSAFQSFGMKPMGGDIKYRDLNGDGIISGNDAVPLGHPNTPEINYGFGFSVGYSSFDVSAFFQGSARSSFWINSKDISPFVVNGGSQNGLLDVIAKDHWSEDNRNSYALWPRLSEYFIDNNNVTSTWWMRNGAFLRLKTVELGYNLPQKTMRKYKFSNVRIYANGSNLWVASKFKMWDPEMGGNGLGYPVQRVFNVGVNLGF
jgi:TonB-linked SusC/RagA family outer membrane protein